MPLGSSEGPRKDAGWRSRLSYGCRFRTPHFYFMTEMVHDSGNAGIGRRTLHSQTLLLHIYLRVCSESLLVRAAHLRLSCLPRGREDEQQEAGRGHGRRG